MVIVLLARHVFPGSSPYLKKFECLVLYGSHTQRNFSQGQNVRKFKDLNDPVNRSHLNKICLLLFFFFPFHMLGIRKLQYFHFLSLYLPLFAFLQLTICRWSKSLIVSKAPPVLTFSIHSSVFTSYKQYFMRLLKIPLSVFSQISSDKNLNSPVSKVESHKYVR